APGPVADEGTLADRGRTSPSRSVEGQRTADALSASQAAAAVAPKGHVVREGAVADQGRSRGRKTADGNGSAGTAPGGREGVVAVAADRLVAGKGRMRHRHGGRIDAEVAVVLEVDRSALAALASPDQTAIHSQGLVVCEFTERYLHVAAV